MTINIFQSSQKESKLTVSRVSGKATLFLHFQITHSLLSYSTPYFPSLKNSIFPGDWSIGFKGSGGGKWQQKNKILFSWSSLLNLIFIILSLIVASGLPEARMIHSQIKTIKFTNNSRNPQSKRSINCFPLFLNSLKLLLHLFLLF